MTLNNVTYAIELISQIDQMTISTPSEALKLLRTKFELSKGDGLKLLSQLVSRGVLSLGGAFLILPLSPEAMTLGDLFRALDVSPLELNNPTAWPFAESPGEVLERITLRHWFAFSARQKEQSHPHPQRKTEYKQLFGNPEWENSVRQEHASEEPELVDLFLKITRRIIQQERQMEQQLRELEEILQFLSHHPLFWDVSLLSTVP